MQIRADIGGAQQCREGGSETESIMHRAQQGRGRTPLLKTFVPYTDEYLRRRDLRRNAMLVDVIRPANLGRSLQQTIATAMANRFGGYSSDFFVAKYRDREFAIFLPNNWVSAEMLIRRPYYL